MKFVDFGNEICILRNGAVFFCIVSHLCEMFSLVLREKWGLCWTDADKN